MNRDQLYGVAIFVISLIVVVGYLVAFFPQVFSQPVWLHDWAVGLPVLLFVLVVLVIAMWIGWTMMTTPPPAPLEPETLPETKADQKP
jgi:protein-S-isoprenylcysteine O-methyltransferase Ste14